MKLIVLIEIFIVNTVLGEDSEITRAMKMHEVIPDLLDEGPAELLKVKIIIMQRKPLECNSRTFLGFFR